MSDGSGFKAIISGLTGHKSVEPMLGHTFVGYRRKGLDQFVAVFTLDCNKEQAHDQYTCEQITKNAGANTERYEAAKLALKHWPR